MPPTRRATTSASSGSAVLLEEVPRARKGHVVPSGGAGHVVLQHLGPSAGTGIAVGERGEEGPRRSRAARPACAGSGGRRHSRGEAHEQGQLARPGAEGLVGERRVVGRQHAVRHVRRGGPLDEEAGPEGRQLLGETLVVQQRLLRPVTVPSGPA